MENKMNIKYECAGIKKELHITDDEIEAGLRRLRYHVLKNIDKTFNGNWKMIFKTINDWNAFQKDHRGMDYHEVYGNMEKFDRFFGLDYRKIRTLFGDKFNGQSGIILKHLKDEKRILIFPHAKLYHSGKFEGDDKGYQSPIKGKSRASHPKKYILPESELQEIYGNKELHDRIVDFNSGYLTKQDITYVNRHFVFKEKDPEKEAAVKKDAAVKNDLPAGISRPKDTKNTVTEQLLQDFINRKIISVYHAKRIQQAIPWMNKSYPFREAYLGWSTEDLRVNPRGRATMYKNLITYKEKYGLNDDAVKEFTRELYSACEIFQPTPPAQEPITTPESAPAPIQEPQPVQGEKKEPTAEETQALIDALEIP